MADEIANTARLMKVAEAVVDELDRQGVAEALASLGFDPMEMAKAVQLFLREPSHHVRNISLVNALVVVADHRGPASGSQFVEAVNIGVLNDHMAICFSRAGRRAAR